MMRTWYPNDQGILIACRVLEGSLTVAEKYDEEEVHYNKGVGGTNQLEGSVASGIHMGEL